MTANQFVAQLKKWKVPYRTTLGWKTRNRAGHGDWGNMHGIVNHHTASAAGTAALTENRLLKRGRPDLPGPLCNGSPARNGRLYLIGWGRANHAGSVRPEVLNDFLNDRRVSRPHTTAGETVDANAWTYGFEVQNNGLGERYTDKQLQTLVLTNAAICDFHNWSANAASQHKNITARKTDMAAIYGENADDWLNREVRLALELGPGNYSWPHKAVPVKPAVKPPAVHPADDEDKPMVLYRTPQDPTAYEVSGASLVFCSGTRADAVRARGVTVAIAIVAKTDPIWKLPKVGAP